MIAPAVASGVADYFDPQPDPMAGDPVGWVNDRLGEHLWSKQRDICEAVRDHRYTSVRSCHGSGKSYTASRLAAWWLDTHPLGDAFVVTTAPTQPQVNAILWREIRRAHRKGGLDGRITLDANWYMGADELVAYGRKPADYTDPTQAAAAFQGIHEKYVLVIMDEACGIPRWLWDAVDTLATNEYARVLAIGNPDDPASQFSTTHKPKSGWERIAISANDTPAFTGEEVPEGLLDQLVSKTWVKERAERWGEDSNLFISKVLGEFPEASDDTLISMAMYLAACNRELPGLKKGQYGVDVSRSGKDESTIYRNRGGKIRHEWSRRGTDMKTTTRLQGEVAMRLEKRQQDIPAIIDVIGVGGGVYDNLEAEGHNVVPFNASNSASDSAKFMNARAEQYWVLRDLMNEGAIDLDEADEELGAQLTSMKYKINNRGLIQIESKDDMKKRGLPSPDRADGAMMSTVVAEDWTDEAEELVEESRSELTGGLMTRPM